MPSITSEMLTFGYDIISRGKQKIKCSKFQAFETWLILYIHFLEDLHYDPTPHTLVYLFFFVGDPPLSLQKILTDPC